ncbi:MAG: class I SAM-dependent methyltransferase [Bdellovibrionota bacterium]
MLEEVRRRYEDFPYPPVSALALPRRAQGSSLALPEPGARILVAGAGTLEALVVAQANPRAAEVLAVDLSGSSLGILRRRVWLARIARPWQRIARITTRVADLHEFHEPEDGPFDFILASNVLHHVDDPAGLLRHLASLLRPEGLLRMVTYPAQSRLWMRETASYFRERGLTQQSPRLDRRCAEAIRELPEKDPRRSCFESQPETSHLSGLLDAFFHPCEHPLRPLLWKAAAESAGLTLQSEAQTETSRSTFLDVLAPACADLDAWTKLQILDDLLELCANPALWLRKTGPLGPRPAGLEPEPGLSLEGGLERARGLLAPTPLSEVLTNLAREVGPRVDSRGRPLPGLSILDHFAGGDFSPAPLRL